MRAQWLSGLSFVLLFLSQLLTPPTADAGMLTVLGAAGGPDDVATLDRVSSGPAITDLVHYAVNGVGSAQFLGFADFGSLRTLSGAESEDPGQNRTWSAGGNASWSDTFRIMPTNPARLGQLGMLVTTIGVAGSGGVGPTAISDFWAGSASWQLTTFLSTQVGADQNGFYGQWIGNSFVAPTYAGSPLSGSITSTVPFVFGGDIVTQVTLTTTASAEIGSFGKSESYADFLHSVAWGGFVEVRDAGGNPLDPAEYSVDADSSTDWSQPQGVPEPSMPDLIAVGALAVSVLSRSRRVPARTIASA